MNEEFPFQDYGIDLSKIGELNMSQTKPQFEEFIEMYLPKIGKSVRDEYFNTKRLTKTGILNKTIDIYFKPIFKDAYDEADYETIVINLAKLTLICRELGIKSKYYNMDSNNKYLPWSLGNDKIGDDTLCISLNTGLLCYMGLTGHCENCDICYAKNSNKMYSSEFVKNNIAQYCFIVSDTLKLALNTVRDIKKEMSKNKVKNIKFLRFNVNGDFLDDWQLAKANLIASILKKELNIAFAYTYTHNKSLDLSIATEIVINTSFRSNHPKNCLTYYNLEDVPTGCIICNGDCNRCSYCKNPSETRTIVFLAHGGKFKGVNQLTPQMRQILEENKLTDYIKFCQEFNIEEEEA